MARIRTASEMSLAEVMSLKSRLAVELKNELAKELKRSPDEIVVRDVMAKQDLGLDSEKWDNELSTGLGATAWTKDWSKELPKTKKIGFYGIVNHTDDPQVIGARFKVGAAGGTIRDTVMFGRTKMEEVVKCFFDPIKYKPGETIYMELYNSSGSTIAEGDELIEFLALVAEPYGEVVSTALPDKK